MALSDLLRPRIAELGHIKIGGLGEERTAKSGSKYRMPEKYDHFLITTMQRDDAGDLIEDAPLMEALSEHVDKDGKLRQLPIMLLSNEPDEIMQAAWIWYNGKRLAAKSDGKTLTLFFDRDKGAWYPEPKEIPWEPKYADVRGPDGKAPLFKLHTTLNVVISSNKAKWGGYYKFRSTSRITADQLYGSLIHLRQLTGGILRGLPLRLVVRPMQVSPDGKATTVYVVHVELMGTDLTQIQTLALERAKYEVSHARQLAAAQEEYRKVICQPDAFASHTEEAEVGQEFHPHQQPETGKAYPEKPPAAAAGCPTCGEIGGGCSCAKAETVAGNAATAGKSA